MVKGRPLARDDLLADGLRVRVDVRPAPVRGAVEARLDRGWSAMNLRFTRPSSRANGAPVHRLAAREQVLVRALGELALPERVLAAVPRLRDEVEALGNLAVGVPELARRAPRSAGKGTCPARPRGWAPCGCPRRSRCSCGRATVAERARELDEVLGAERVRVERLVERRVEVDDAGDVDDRVDVPELAPASMPQRGLPMSPSMGTTFSRRNASYASPYLSRIGRNGSLLAMVL